MKRENVNIDGLLVDTPIYWIAGIGKWRDNDGDIYDITAIKYPPTGN